MFLYYYVNNIFETGATKNPNLSTLEKLAVYLEVPKEAFYGKEPRRMILASKVLESLPDDIVEAIGDVRKIKYLLLGLKFESSGLSEDEIEYAVEEAKKWKEKYKK